MSKNRCEPHRTACFCRRTDKDECSFKEPPGKAGCRHLRGEWMCDSPSARSAAMAGDVNAWMRKKRKENDESLRASGIDPDKGRLTDEQRKAVAKMVAG